MKMDVLWLCCRVCGMDEFLVEVTPVKTGKGGKEEDSKLDVPVHILDQNDGTYLVTYTLPAPGKYTVR